MFLNGQITNIDDTQSINLTKS